MYFYGHLLQALSQTLQIKGWKSLAYEMLQEIKGAGVSAPEEVRALRRAVGFFMEEEKEQDGGGCRYTL